MPRPTVALAAALTAAALLAGTAPGSVADDRPAGTPAGGPVAGPGPADARSDRTDGGDPGLPGTLPAPPAPPGSAAAAAFERRAFDARRPALSANPVTRLPAAAAAGGPGSGAVERPNVLVLLTDDMREDDLQFMPHVQALIGDQGVRFHNALAPQSLCCPSRASFLTGWYSHNHEVWSHKDPYGFRVLDDSETLPVWLHELGYTTSYLGKYLNGYGSQPLLDGSPSGRYVPPGWTDWRGSVDETLGEAAHLRGGTYRYFSTTVNRGGRLEPHTGVYQTHQFSATTQDMIRTQARSPQPFFVMASFAAPHTGSPAEADDPVDFERADGSVMRFKTPARPDYVNGRFGDGIAAAPGWPAGDMSGKPAYLRARLPLTATEFEGILEIYRQRAESLSVLDDEVANIMATLAATGELDNTYVVFTSDNGFLLGEHRMPKSKNLPYDPSVRLPLMVRGPGVPVGEVRTDPMLTIDVAPTLLSLAGDTRLRTVDGPLDGRDLSDVLLGGDRGWDRAVLVETGPRGMNPRVRAKLPASARGGPGAGPKLLDRADGPSRERFTQGVRTGRWLYLEHASREQELYDVAADPRQVENLAGTPRWQRVQRQLAAELERLRDCVGAQCRAPLPRSLRTDSPAPAHVPDPARPMDLTADGTG